MSSLTEALNRILNWLQKNYPLGAASLQPGLSILEIEEATKTLPFCLPQEVWELYQWANGCSQEALLFHAAFFDISDGMSLCTLELAKQLTQILGDEICDIALRYMGRPLFPIFESEVVFLAIVGDEEKKETSPVIYISEIRDILVRYTSLTNMMLTIAESYETGAWYVNKNGYLAQDEAKFAPIYRKYNS